MKFRLFACLSVALLFQAPVSAGDVPDALAEVNAKRAARGLPPFQYDPGLTQAAYGAASYRAQYGLFGHTSNDFAFVPPGASASSAGCAAYPASYGFMACCVYDNYTRAGAVSVPGRDGRMYHHLFVGYGSTGGAAPPAAAPAPAAVPPVVYASPCTSSAQQTVRVRVTIRERMSDRPRLFARCR